VDLNCTRAWQKGEGASVAAGAEAATTATQIAATEGSHMLHTACDGQPHCCRGLQNVKHPAAGKQQQPDTA